MTANDEQNQVQELENHLNSSLNRVVYHRLTKGDKAGWFKPLEFFNQLRGLYLYATVKRPKASVLAEMTNQINLTDAQKSFLLHYLDILFLEDSARNTIEQQFHPESKTEVTLEIDYQVAIFAEWAKLQPPVDDLYGYKDSLLYDVRREYVHRRPGGKDDLARQVRDMSVKERLRLTMKDRYNFNRVKQHLDTLPDNETKIIYLAEIKAEYLQVGATSDPRSKRFDQKCDFEIAKLEKLNELPKLRTLMDLAPNNQATERKAPATKQGWSEKEYLILAVPAAKAIGRRGNRLTDERMAEELEVSRRTAVMYRNKYTDASDVWTHFIRRPRDRVLAYGPTLPNNSGLS